MWGLKELLDSIATDAIGGGFGDHYFDEFRNREFIEAESITPENSERISKSSINSSDKSLEPYDVGLIRDTKTGKFRWRNGLHDNL